MKKVMIIAILISGLAMLSSFSISNKVETPNITIVEGDDFNQGWEDGYCEGWKDVMGPYSYCPYAPYPPYPPYGKDNYRGGYNMGFKAGMRAAYNSN